MNYMPQNIDESLFTLHCCFSRKLVIELTEFLR